MIQETITYFEEPGTANTEVTLDLAIARARARGIKKIILASTRGETAKTMAGKLANSGITMVVVPHQYGFMASGQRFTRELAAELEGQGHVVHFGTMLFHTERFYGVEAPKTLADLLRAFCQGMKVVVEITLMAADGGKVEIGEDVVVVAGTGRGADTAVVAAASTSTHFKDFHITEIICKPLRTKHLEPPKPGEAPPRP
jgi:hypothetical protein